MSKQGGRGLHGENTYVSTCVYKYSHITILVCTVNHRIEERKREADSILHKRAKSRLPYISREGGKQSL